MSSQSNQELFRSEALAAQGASWAGSIRLARNPSHSMVAVVSLLLGVLMVAFVAFGHVTKKTTLGGVLLPSSGLIPVVAQQSAVIAEVLVAEGDSVKKGQPLMRLRSDRSLGDGREANALQLTSIRQREQTLVEDLALNDRQASEREAASIERLRKLEGELALAGQELIAIRAREDVAIQAEQQMAKLLDDGFVARAQLLQKQSERLETQLRVHQAERSVASISRDISTARAEILAGRLAAQSSRSSIARARALLAQELTEQEARTQAVLAAPSDGQVSGLTLAPGQSVQTGQAVVNIVSKDSSGAQSLVAQMFAPSRLVGFVSAGQRVLIRYDAFPYQKFGMHSARVLSVSEAPVSAQELMPANGRGSIQASNGSEQYYVIRLALDSTQIKTYGENKQLMPGATFEADVMQERRSIFEWIIDPILAASGISK